MLTGKKCSPLKSISLFDYFLRNCFIKLACPFSIYGLGRYYELQTSADFEISLDCLAIMEEL